MGCLHVTEYLHPRPFLSTPCSTANNCVRAKNGWVPTNQLISEAESLGYESVRSRGGEGEPDYCWAEAGQRL